MLKPSRFVISVLLIGLITGVAYVAQSTEPAGIAMATTADRIIAGLSAEQKAKTLFAIDDPERTNWHFVPHQDKMKRPLRKGLRLDEMSAEQKDQTLALLRVGTSATGYTAATTIMTLESILRAQETNGANNRDPQWYFLTIFGTPARTGRWGWRFEGHHLSLNFVVEDGVVVAATPAFFGANPATVKTGPKQGQRVLGDIEDQAIALYKSLDADQQKIAFRGKQFPEIEQEKAKPNVGPATGLKADAMTPEQRAQLMKLLEAYTYRLPAEVAEAELKQVKASAGDIHFAYAGGTEPGQPHTYRIQGPTFVVEFINVQEDAAKNVANHIHSAWRHLNGDFGVVAN